jgi:membrane-bound serine protease (ClpP class)
MFASSRHKVAWVPLAAAALASGVVDWSWAQTHNSTTRPSHIAIIPITGGESLDGVTFTSLERRCNKAIAEGADVLVIELDTPGGLVDASRRMMEMLIEIGDSRGIRTIAWVRHEAISGGSMVAMGCKEIIMSRQGKIGDSGVVMMGPQGVTTATDDALDAKIDSYVLTLFRSAANRNGYDPVLCESFVRHEYEVWWIEHTGTNERRFVETEEKDALLGEDGDGAWQLVEGFLDPLDDTTKRIRQPIVSKSELLTLDQSEAYAVGLSRAIVHDEAALHEYIGATQDARVDRHTVMWSESLVKWLTDPMVRMVLIAMLGIGAYTEFKAPGIGLPGLVAVISLAILVGAPYLSGLANFWEIVLIVAGIGLLGAEVFIVPGFGIAGIAGLVCLAIGMLSTFVPENPTLPPISWPTSLESIDGVQTGLKTISTGLAVALLGMVGVSKYFHRIPYVRSIVAANPTQADVLIDYGDDDVTRIGSQGRAESQLRPAGKAWFGPALLDVVTEGDWVEAGERVEVIRRRGNCVVVRRIEIA